MKLAGSVVLITGGTKGIGAATAVALADLGAHLAIVGRHLDDQTKELQHRIEAEGQRCLLIAADVSQGSEARRCVRETFAHFGSIDAIVHSAGGPVPGTLMELTEEQWLAAFAVHVHPVFHLCQEALPLMRAKQQGAVVLVSSAAGLRGVMGSLAYQAVKGTLPQLTRALAREAADDNVRVNCVAPGVIRTAFHATMPPEVRKVNIERRIPLHREGTPEQVAELICELIGNDYITGETVSIDGGLTMRIC